MNSAEYYIEKLKLEKHPEGGSFIELFRSSDIIKNKDLPFGFGEGDRSVCTSIYFLIQNQGH